MIFDIFLEIDFKIFDIENKPISFFDQKEYEGIKGFEKRIERRKKSSC